MENSVDLITDLWSRGLLLIKDGLYFVGEGALDVSIVSYPQPRVVKGGAFTPRDFYTGTNTTFYGVTRRVECALGGALCMGEASWGAEGFIAYLNRADKLVWLLYAEFSNPFINAVEKEPGMFLVDSSAEFSVVVNVSQPQGICLAPQEFWKK